MQLRQLDVTASLFLASGRECKVITGIDDRSRFCVITAVVARATGRAVCSAFVEAMRAYGVPAEVLPDNGRQFAGRLGRPRPAEALFDGVCRRTASPTAWLSPAHPRRARASGCSAPRCALSYPRFSREEIA
jgi:Integrase core domain